MTSTTSRKTSKYKSALILILAEVGVIVCSVGLTVTVAFKVEWTVDEGPVRLGKRSLLQRDSKQHTATQCLKYTWPERVLFLLSQVGVLHSVEA